MKIYLKTKNKGNAKSAANGCQWGRSNLAFFQANVGSSFMWQNTNFCKTCSTKIGGKK